MSCPGGNYQNNNQAQQASEQRDNYNNPYQRDPQRAKTAAGDLCELMRLKLDVAIDPTAMRLFLAVHWKKVETLAHTIHNNEG